jgi:hypothetical protein
MKLRKTYYYRINWWHHASVPMRNLYLHIFARSWPI